MADQTKCPVCDAPIDANMTVCERCGFKLVGQTEEFEHVDVDSDGVATAPHEKLSTPTLTILKGPLAGETFHITSFPLVIGRDPSCDLFLNDMTVTRKHATIDVIDNAISISDMNSLNGTWVDGQIHDHAELKDGTIIQIGTFTMVFNV